MFRHHILRASPMTISGASFLALAFAICAFPQAAAAAGDNVALDDFSMTAKDGSVITIKHADFQGTNLSKDEIVKLLNPDTPPEEASALMHKAKFSSISIPQVDVAPKKGGAVHIHGIAASDIDSGKVGKFGFSGVDGSATDKDGPVSVKAGALLIEDADLADAVASAKDPEHMSPLSRLGHLSLEGVDVTAPEADGGAGKTIHVTLSSVDIRNNYDGAVFKDGVTKVKSLVIEPSKGSDLANTLGLLDFSRIELSANIAAHYDAASKKFNLDEFTIDGANAGAITVKANLTDISPTLFGADRSARMGALAGGAISSLELKFVNAGLFEKATAYFAKEQNQSPDAVKKSWSAAAGQMLPAVLGGDPAALKLAAETQKFIGSPSNLTISLHPKSGSLKFADAMSISSPLALLGAIDIVAAANK